MCTCAQEETDEERMQHGVVSPVLISESHVLMMFSCGRCNSLILHKMLMLFCLLKLEV